jgi:hypothetical protein
MENIWFDGGAWTCAWGGGVIQYLKQNYPDLISNYDNVGGYSAGGFLAMNVHLDFNEPDFWYCFEHEIHGFGKYHLWAEEVANRVWEKDVNKKLINTKNLSIVIYSFNLMQPIIRHSWKTKEEFINFTKASTNIPIMCQKGLHYVKNHGWSVDGGLTQRNPPSDWNETFIISPWRNSSKNIIGPSKGLPSKLLIMGDFDLCRKIFDQGIEDAKLWIKKYY